MNHPINKLIDSVCHPVPPPDDITGGVPYITHEGILHHGGVDLKVCVISTGQRLILAESVEKYLSIGTINN